MLRYLIPLLLLAGAAAAQEPPVAETCGTFPPVGVRREVGKPDPVILWQHCRSQKAERDERERTARSRHSLGDPPPN